MKALTVRQPWASLIATGVKTIETRSRATHHRGPLAIHAGLHPPPLAWHHDADNTTLPAAVDLVAMARYWDWAENVDDYTSGGSYKWCGPLGAVVAVAEVIDCVPIQDGQNGPLGRPGLAVLGSTLTYFDRAVGSNADVATMDDQSPFGDFTPGRWAWLLADARRLPEPIPCRGAQGLWTVPADVEAQLKAAVA